MRPRVVTGNVATLDGRIAACGSVPSWQDDRWAPILKSGIELIDFAKLHGASVILEGSNSFVSRDAGPTLFQRRLLCPDCTRIISRRSCSSGTSDGWLWLTAGGGSNGLKHKAAGCTCSCL